MSIPMEPPTTFMAQLAAGKLVRYGAILKDVNTGQIVGHLKEVGDLGSWLSNIDLPPLSMLGNVNPVTLVTGAANLGLQATANMQLVGIKERVIRIQATLEGMQLATNVAALASVASLGISVAGFAAVNRKLTHIESKLDAVANDIAVIKKTLGEMHLSWEAMSLAKLQKASETLVAAESASTVTRSLELAKIAAEDFTLLKRYYHNLLQREGLFDDISLPTQDLYDLISRYTFCCTGLLHAEFMTGDLGVYRTRLDKIREEYDTVVSFSPRAIYQARCDKLPKLALDTNYEELSADLKNLNIYTRESVARIESFAVELDFLERNHLTADQYRKELREMEPGIMVLSAAEVPIPQ